MVLNKEKFKIDRFNQRIADFKKFLVQDLKFIQEEQNFLPIERYKKWLIEYRKYIDISFCKDSHTIEVNCYEMDERCFNFHINLYKGSQSDYVNNKNIIKTLILF